jgi:cell division transport system ATP-binding protein
VIELYNVTKRYAGGQIGLLDVSLQIERGEMVFLTGPSGAGKTTFLKLIYREEVSSDGVLLVNGRNVSSLPTSKVPYLRRTIGVVFQNFRLIPRKTVFENVSYLPRILGLDLKSQRKLAFETLRRVGLAHRINAFPMQLSGGEQQRVAIARALINQPEILLADEPTGNLDPDLSEEILKLFLEINAQGTTLIFATHDRDIIGRLGRRVITLEAGRLVDDTRPDGATPAATDKVPVEVEDEFGTSANLVFPSRPASGEPPVVAELAAEAQGENAEAVEAPVLASTDEDAVEGIAEDAGDDTTVVGVDAVDDAVDEAVDAEALEALNEPGSAKV